MRGGADNDDDIAKSEISHLKWEWPTGMDLNISRWLFKLCISTLRWCEVKYTKKPCSLDIVRGYSSDRLTAPLWPLTPSVSLLLLVTHLEVNQRWWPWMEAHLSEILSVSPTVTPDESSRYTVDPDRGDKDYRYSRKSWLHWFPHVCLSSTLCGNRKTAWANKPLNCT